MSPKLGKLPLLRLLQSPNGSETFEKYISQKDSVSDFCLVDTFCIGTEQKYNPNTKTNSEN